MGARPSGRAIRKANVASKSTGFDRARKLTAGFPGVEVGKAWGTDALTVGGKMFACIPTNRDAEPNSLAIRVSFADRDELIAAAPETYYVKQHYLNYPCVLVRLNEVADDALRDLLLMGMKFVGRSAPKKPRARPTATKAASRRPRSA